MKFEIKPFNGRDNEFVACTSDPDLPLWIMLRKSDGENRMTGFFGRSVSGGIAILRPVSIPRHDKYLNLGDESLCSLIVAAVDGVTIRSAGKKAVTSKAVEQLSIWDDYLGGDTPKLSDKSVVLEVGVEEFAKLQTLMRLDELGSLAFDHKKTVGIRIGQPVSGFDALKIQSVVAKAFPVINPPTNLDLDAARKSLKAVSRPSSGSLVWYGAKDPEVVKIRMQAAASMPILAGVIADNPTMVRAVDAMESLQPLLIERTKLTKGGLKRLAQLTTPIPAEPLFGVDEQFEGEDALGVYRRRRFSNSGDLSLDAALRPLSELPPDWAPSDDASWKAYTGILASCAYPLSNVLGVPVVDILKASKGKWIEFRENLARAADFPPENFDDQTMMLTSLDAIDAIDSFSRLAILPLALHAINSVGEPEPPVFQEHLTSGFEAAKSVLIGKSKNVAATCYELTRRFASRLVYLNDIMEREAIVHGDYKWDKYGVDSFPKLFDDFPTSNGYVIRHLDQRAFFVRETARLGHCVGQSPSYFTNSFSGSTHVASIQSPDGETSYSTFQISGLREIKSADHGIQFPKKIQHRAGNNGVPGPELETAYDEFKEAWDGKRLTFHIKENQEWWSFVARTKKEQTINGGMQITWKGALELEWKDETKRLDAWGEWRHVLTGSLAEAETPEILFRDAKVRRLVGVINPQAAILLQRQAAAKKLEVEAGAAPEPE